MCSSDLYAKANPGKLNYGSTGAGGPPHLAVELLNYMAKVKITHIVYKGISLVVTANLSNEIQVATPNLFTGLPHVRGGKLRALGITSAKRSVVAPDWPTIAEAGLPGYEASIWYGFLAPAKTPPAVVNRLHREITAVLQSADVKQTIVSQGGEAIGNTPAEFGKLLRDDVTRIAALVKTAGLRAE